MLVRFLKATISRRRPRPSTLVAAAAATFGTLFSLCAPARSAADAAPFLWGINGHALVSNADISVQEQIDLVADLGLGSYRIEVTDRDQMDRLAALIARGKASGVAILPILLPPVDMQTMSLEDLYEKSYAFAQAYVRRFSRDIRVWELGNELETFALIQPCETRDDKSRYPCSWGPAAGTRPEDYVGARMNKVTAVLRGLSDATRAADPKVRRAIGTAGWGHMGAFDRFQENGVGWDISVWHHHGGNPERAFKTLAKFGRPIWVTEVNQPADTDDGGEEGQAKRLEEDMTVLRNLAPKYNIEAAFVYELFDEAGRPQSRDTNMGLVQLQQDVDGHWALGNHKIAYQTLRRIIALQGQ